VGLWDCGIVGAFMLFAWKIVALLTALPHVTEGPSHSLLPTREGNINVSIIHALEFASYRTQSVGIHFVCEWPTPPLHCWQKIQSNRSRTSFTELEVIPEITDKTWTPVLVFVVSVAIDYVCVVLRSRALSTVGINRRNSLTERSCSA
jgi:hypothetical protein